MLKAVFSGQTLEDNPDHFIRVKANQQGGIGSGFLQHCLSEIGEEVGPDGYTLLLKLEEVVPVRIDIISQEIAGLILDHLKGIISLVKLKAPL